MVAGRSKSRLLRIAALVAAAGPAVALVTALGPGRAGQRRGHRTGTRRTGTRRGRARGACQRHGACGERPGGGRAGRRGEPGHSHAFRGPFRHRPGSGPCFHGPLSPAAASPAGAPARAAAAAGAHRVTFVNRVTQAIWVAAAQNPAHPLARTGWTLKPGHRLTITFGLTPSG